MTSMAFFGVENKLMWKKPGVKHIRHLSPCFVHIFPNKLMETKNKINNFKSQLPKLLVGLHLIWAIFFVCDAC